jgi:hypothetical protein
MRSHTDGSHPTPVSGRRRVRRRSADCRAPQRAATPRADPAAPARPLVGRARRGAQRRRHPVPRSTRSPRLRPASKPAGPNPHGGVSAAPVDRTAASTRAERVLSVVSAAGSLTLTADGHRCELTGPHQFDHTARLLVHAPATSHGRRGRPRPARRARRGGGVHRLTPAAVRERVRARVKLRGLLTLATQPRR